MAYHRRTDSLDFPTMGIASGLHIHRSVDKDISIFSGFGTLLQGDIIEGERELLVHLLRTMNQGDARCINSHLPTNSHIVTNHRIQMIQRRIRNHRRIREEQQLIIGRNLCYRDMTQHTSLRQETVFLVQHRTKQVVGIDNTLHQHVSMTFAHQEHTLLSSHIGTAGLEHFHMIGVLLTNVLSIYQMGGIRYQQEVSKTLTQTSDDDILRMRVIRTYHHYALTLLHGSQATD